MPVDEPKQPSAAPSRWLLRRAAAPSRPAVRPDTKADERRQGLNYPVLRAAVIDLRPVPTPGCKLGQCLCRVGPWFGDLGGSMSVVLRPGTPTDAAICGPICFDAFKAINDTHHFPPDFPSAEIATGLLGMLLSHPGFYAVVAETDGKIVGSNFLDERGPISGVGPITVDPTIQNKAIGR